MNIVEPIFVQVKNKPSELALCAPGTDLNIVSYARLQRTVNNICWRIISAGISPRSRIAVVIDDPIFHAMVLIALTRLGIVTISVGRRNISLPVKLDGLIADKPHESPGGRTILADPTWTAQSDQAIDERYLYRAPPDEVCRLILTSGWDGREKVIALTNRMIATGLDRQKLFLGPRAAFCDRTCLDLPLTTPLGFQILLATLWRGGALVMTWDVRKTLTALPTYNVQNMVASPQGLLKFIETIENYPGSQSALLAVFCAGRIASGASKRVRARLCSNLTVGYMAADATMVAALPAHLASGIAGAVGYVVPSVTVKIVDGQGRVLPPGTEGDVCLRSDLGVTEYLEDPTETQRAFRDGWFHLGERGCLTRDNMLLLSSPDDGAQNVGGE
jgi:acyl-CoA synthetase (AMP-forming)/AMP-acid ligase II